MPRMATGLSGKKEDLWYMRRFKELQILKTTNVIKKIISAHKYIKKEEMKLIEVLVKIKPKISYLKGYNEKKVI